MQCKGIMTFRVTKNKPNWTGRIFSASISRVTRTKIGPGLDNTVPTFDEWQKTGPLLEPRVTVEHDEAERQRGARYYCGVSAEDGGVVEGCGDEGVGGATSDDNCWLFSRTKLSAVQAQSTCDRFSISGIISSSSVSDMSSNHDVTGTCTCTLK